MDDRAEPMKDAASPDGPVTAAAAYGSTSALWTFTLTTFLSALLLFSLQPMFAKMVLPVLGGSPSVWAVAMCFFQGALLVGYCYAHVLNRWVGLGQYLDVRPSTLSGGQQQRVAIARAVITRPALLLADEPTGNVDDAIAFRLLHLFEELNRLGTTVMIATHNQTLIDQFNYPVLHLEEGRLSQTRQSVDQGIS